MHVFKYSPRKGTKAASFSNQVDGKTKILRSEKLIELSEEYIQIDSDVPKNFVKKDGASRIANFLFEEANNINFFHRNIL